MSDQNAISRATLERAATVIKCLGHPLRLLLLQALNGAERTVSELQDLSGAQQASVSRQLAIMRGKDIVDCRREGLHVYYWIVEPRVSSILDCIDIRIDGED